MAPVDGRVTVCASAQPDLLGRLDLDHLAVLRDDYDGSERDPYPSAGPRMEQERPSLIRQGR